MKKEIIVASFIIIFVVVAEIVTANTTDKKMTDMNNKLEVLEIMVQESMNEDDVAKKDMRNQEIKNCVVQIKNKWEKDEEILSLYIEHDELEKIGTEVHSLYSYIESRDDTECLDSIARLEFILDHLSKKQDFKLNNFF